MSNNFSVNISTCLESKCLIFLVRATFSG